MAHLTLRFLCGTLRAMMNLLTLTQMSDISPESDEYRAQVMYRLSVDLDGLCEDIENAPIRPDTMSLDVAPESKTDQYAIIVHDARGRRYPHTIWTSPKKFDFTSDDVLAALREHHYFSRWFWPLHTPR